MTQFTKQVLDHGFVTLRNMAGPTRRISNDMELFKATDRVDEGFARNFDADDTDVANSARMSFDGVDVARTYAVEMKLNRYLMQNKHMTPFESIEVWLEMKLPIMVARQLIRHRTATVNEVSGRYITLPAEWYIPEIVGGAASNKKQGQEDNLPLFTQNLFKRELDKACKDSYSLYLDFIEQGVAAEHARMFLHVNHYTHWLWKQDLRNLMHMLSLRQHGHAQIESRVYADAVFELLESELPGLMALYKELVQIQ